MIKKTNGKCISMFGSHPIVNHLINSWIKPLKSSWNSRILNTSSKHFRSSIKIFRKHFDGPKCENQFSFWVTFWVTLRAGIYGTTKFCWSLSELVRDFLNFPGFGPWIPEVEYVSGNRRNFKSLSKSSPD